MRLYKVAKGTDETQASLATHEMAMLIRICIPYTRGSTGIADAATVALLEPRGYIFGEIRPGIGFDVKSWAADSVESFAHEFPSFFVGSAPAN